MFYFIAAILVILALPFRWYNDGADAREQAQAKAHELTTTQVAAKYGAMVAIVDFSPVPMFTPTGHQADMIVRYSNPTTEALDVFVVCRVRQQSKLAFPDYTSGTLMPFTVQPGVHEIQIMPSQGISLMGFEDGHVDQCWTGVNKDSTRDRALLEGNS